MMANVREIYIVGLQYNIILHNSLVIYVIITMKVVALLNKQI